MPLFRYGKAVVILRCRSLGKTSFAHQFVEFLEGDPTVENTYSKVTLGKDDFHLHLVDTAGQDEYSILPYSLIIGVHGYVLVYLVTSPHSFQVIDSLYQKLHEGHGKAWLPVVIVGNKADLSIQEMQAVEGKTWDATFMESPARENQVTQGIFTEVTQISYVENSYGQER
ncbi:LOW QUALITY PROTEIN: GTPase RhebL1 [Ctenodactylus gundi]